jgi:hypothetical protein
LQNNADEGPAWVPRNITTQAALINWLHTQFPSLTDSDINQLLAAYPSPNVPDDPNSVKFDTNGLGPATVVNVSQVATGHQQRAYVSVATQVHAELNCFKFQGEPRFANSRAEGKNMYAESTFVCPSYWLATAFARTGCASYRYQYSISFAIHAYDWNAQFVSPPFPNQSPEFVAAFRRE